MWGIIWSKNYIKKSYIPLTILRENVHYNKTLVNITAESLDLLLHILEVPSSTADLETISPDRFACGIPQPPQQN
jgi:hypothetical protein